MIKYFVTKRPVEIKEEIDNMPEPDLKDGDSLSKEQKHEKIQVLLDEIKGFEDKFPGYAVKEPEIIEGEGHFSDVSDGDSTRDGEKELTSEMELEKSGLKPKSRRFRIRIRRRKSKVGEDLTDAEVLTKVKEITPTTFRVGINESGKVVNLDLRKPKIKPKSESRFKKLAVLKDKLHRKKGGKTESEGTEEKSKASKFKGAFGKVGKLKKAIPHKSKKKKEEGK